MPKKRGKSERKEAWFRILVLIISGIILALWKHLVAFLTIINWFITIFSGKRNKGIANFSEYFNTENYKYNHYLTFVSNKRPFPFTDIERMKKFER